MLLHLVRHAHALAAEEDPFRPLSPRGREEVARLAAVLGASGAFVPAQVWHSPLARSRQPADGLVARLGLDPVMVEAAGLAPDDDPEPLARHLELHPLDRGDLCVVGHEPHLSALAGLLIRGKPSPAPIVLRKAAALALEPTGGSHKSNGLRRWRVRWLLAPELFPPLVRPAGFLAAPSSVSP